MEAQSRYGIISSLTHKKLELIEMSDSLESDINEAKQKLEVAKKNLKIDQERIIAEANNHINVLKKEIGDYEVEAKTKCIRIARELDNRAVEISIKAKSAQSKKESIRKQITTIDVALDTLESVSAKSAIENK